MGLVIRYSVFFVISIVAVVLLLSAFLGYFLETMTTDDKGMISQQIEFSGTLRGGDLTLSHGPSNVVWVDYLKDGKVIHSSGDRGEIQETFSTEEINQLLSSVFYAPRKWGYNVTLAFYPYDAGENELALFYKSINAGMSMGINVPDEYKGTAVEAELKSKIKVVYAVILLALAVVIGFFSLLTYRMIIRPIRSLNAGLLAVKHGELGTRIHYKGYVELVELTDSFNEMTARLETAESEAVSIAESKKNMILNLSHDLRTPSTVIQGYAKALMEGKVSEDKKTRYYAYMVEKSSLLVSRIEQLFAYAKLDVGHYELNKSTTELCEFIRLLVIGYLEEMDAHGQQPQIDLPEEPVWAEIDRVELKRAIGNLIENAIKYSGDHTKIHISVTLDDSYKQCVLAIEDDGIGLGCCNGDGGLHQDDLFTPFVRGDLSRHTEGTGLGLAITRQIARLHGGDVVCIPREKGTFFKMTLPYIRKEL